MSVVLPIVTSEWKSLVSVSFEFDSHLERIEAKGFAGSVITHTFVPRSVELIGAKRFASTQLVLWFEFECYSRLKQVEGEAFAGSSIRVLSIPASVEFLGKSCFKGCRSLAICRFESSSCLKFFEPRFFPNQGLNRSTFRGMSHCFRCGILKNAEISNAFHWNWIRI
jgi:hypothetical protein